MKLIPINVHSLFYDNCLSRGDYETYDSPFDNNVAIFILGVLKLISFIGEGLEKDIAIALKSLKY